MLFLFQKKCIFAAANRTGCGAVGSALRSGRRGRKFESSHPDISVETQRIASLLLFKKCIFAPKIRKI